MTRKEAREQAFALIFESAFQKEGLDYIIENAAEASEEPLEIGAFAKELAAKTLENLDFLDENSEKQFCLHRILPKCRLDKGNYPWICCRNWFAGLSIPGSFSYRKYPDQFH